MAGCGAARKAAIRAAERIVKKGPVVAKIKGLSAAERAACELAVQRKLSAATK